MAAVKVSVSSKQRLLLLLLLRALGKHLADKGVVVE